MSRDQPKTYGSYGQPTDSEELSSLKARVTNAERELKVLKIWLICLTSALVTTLLFGPTIGVLVRLILG